MKKIATVLAFALSMMGSQAQPIAIAPTTNFSSGNATTSGLYGAVYNFDAVAGTYSVPNILAPGSVFNPEQVGSYVAQTNTGISYGTVNSSDSQALATWLGTDGTTLTYSAPHITPVFNPGTNQGTLLDLTGYILVTPVMVNVPQTVSLGLDDGGLLAINGTTVIDNGGIHGATTVTRTILFTRAGLYPIELGYYDGHATQAVFQAAFVGATILSTPNGTALVNIQLDPTANDIQDNINQVLNTTVPDRNFTNATNALANLALSGADAATYGAALRELSPLKYGAIDAQMLGGVDFITNDLDDYLAHRRDDAGTFRAGNGLDLSGLSVMGGDVDPGLQQIAGQLLAYNNNQRHGPNQLSDSPDSLISTDNSAQTNQRWNVFSRGIVVLSQNLSGGGLQHSDNTSGTIQIGADYQVCPNLLIGAFFDYTRSDASLDEEGSNFTADSYIPGVYASYARDGWYGNALAAGGVNRFSANREITLPGFDANAQADFDGQEEYAYLSGGRDFHVQHWTFGPTAGLQYVHQSTDSFTENGAGMLDLNVRDNENDSLRSRLGGRVYYAASDGSVTWRPFLDASWQHEFMQNDTSLTAGFDGGGVGDFTVPVPHNTRESALVSLGTDIDINPCTSVFTAYRFEAGSSNFFAQSVEAGFKLNF
jgi:outer membrane autotransporter protein